MLAAGIAASAIVPDKYYSESEKRTLKQFPKLTAEDIKNGSYSYYKTLYVASLPIAEKQLTLPEFEDSAMIFLALESSSGLRSIRYVGEIEAQNQSFSQMLARIFDPMYTFAVIAVLLLGILVAVLIFTGKHTLKSSDGRRRR